MKKTAPTQEADMIIDLKNLDMEGRTGPDSNTRTKNRIFAAIRSNEGLEDVEIRRFMMRHTNRDVHLAYLNIDKEAAKVARIHASEWIEVLLKGAKLIVSTWYPVKIDFVSKIDAIDQNTKGVSEYAKQTFEEENGVEIKQMKWLGRSKEGAACGSVVAKLDSRELVEKLFRMQAKGEEIFMFGSMIKVERFYEEKRPTMCHQCQRYGHIKRDCQSAPRCVRCGEEGQNGCHTDTPRCANCEGDHPASYNGCLEYRKQMERMNNLRLHA